MQIKFGEQLYAHIFHDEEKDVWGYFFIFGGDNDGPTWESERATGFISPESARVAAHQHIQNALLDEIAERENLVAETGDKLASQYREAIRIAEELARYYSEAIDAMDELARHDRRAAKGLDELACQYSELAEITGINHYRETVTILNRLGHDYRKVAETAERLTRHYREMVQGMNELARRYDDEAKAIEGIAHVSREAAELAKALITLRDSSFPSEN